MSYTYSPGKRPDALSILRDKGLLDTPKRLDPKPGTFILGSDGYFQIGEDGRARPVRRVEAVAANDALPAYPLINWRSLGWALVALALCAGLLGLMTVGAA